MIIQAAINLRLLRAASSVWYAGLLGHFEGNPAEVERLASVLEDLLAVLRRIEYWIDASAGARRKTEAQRTGRGMF
jgi:hypothetical protein